jgi:RimJ/RimL family protein N-acetyltransferase
MDERTASSFTNLRIRDATLADCDSVLATRNDPEAVANSVSTYPIPAEHHQAFFRHFLANPRFGECLAVLCCDEHPYMGYFRLQHMDAEIGFRWKLSFALDPPYRGHSLATFGVLAVLARLFALQPPGNKKKNYGVNALVHRSNFASLKTLERCQFVPLASNGSEFVAFWWNAL